MISPLKIDWWGPWWRVGRIVPNGDYFAQFRRVGKMLIWYSATYWDMVMLVAF